MDRDTVSRMVRHFLSPVVTKAVAASVVVGALALLPAQARAQDPSAATSALGQGFGAQGQLVITGDASVHFDKFNGAGWIFEVRPAADYFILPSVTLGAVVGFGIDNESNKGILIGGRAGYVLNVTEHVSAWARAGITYNHISRDMLPSVSATNVALDLPILYHFVPHLFAGLGPYYNLNLDGNDSYGFRSMVGGWF